MIKEYVVTVYVRNANTGHSHTRKVVVYNDLETLARLEAIDFIHNFYASRRHTFSFKILHVVCNILSTRIL